MASHEPHNEFNHRNLQENEEHLRALVDHTSDTLLLHDDQGTILDVNRQACESLGYRRDELIGMFPFDLDVEKDSPFLEQLKARLAMGEIVTFETRHRRKDGTTFPVEVRIRPFREGGRQFAVSLIRDITERKQAEEEHHAHLRFFESMDQINRAIQGTNDLEQMMRDVLNAVLAIFGCDRAWLVYPADPAVATWRVPMERTRPEFPGAFALGLEVPMDPLAAQVIQTMLSFDGPVQFGPDSQVEVARHLGVQSQLGMAIYPKIDKPYIFGLHQCSYPQVWTREEERLFEAIGRRLADGLTSVLMLRNLRESERKLEEAQHIAHVGYWERDLNQDHVILSDETYRIFGIPPQEHVGTLDRRLEYIHPNDRSIVVEAIAAALRGGPRFDLKHRIVRPDGEVRFVHNQGETLRDESGRLRRLFGTMQDITERKQSENIMESRLRLLQFSATHSLNELLVATLDELEILTDSQIGFYHFLEADQKTLLLQAWSTRTRRDMCETEGGERHYDVAEAGIWADCIRERRPVIHNDYAALPNRQGIPPGHVPVMRELVVPVFRGQQIMAVLGVGNKSTNYTSGDVEIVSNLADLAWDITERKRAEEALGHRLRELEALNKVSVALRKARTLEEALPILLDETLAALNTEAGEILLHHAPSDELRSAISRGWFQNIQLIPLKPGEGITGAVFTRGQAYHSMEFARDPLTYSPIREQLPVGWGGVCVPIRSTTAIVGVLFVSVRLPRQIAPEEMQLLESLAEMAGTALHRLRLHEETWRRVNQLQALQTVDRAITTSLDLRVSLNILLEQTLAQLNVDAADVLLLSPYTQMLEYATGRGFQSQAPERSRRRFGQGYSGRAALERRTIQVSHLQETSDTFAPAELFADEGFVTLIATPLIAKGQVLGVLEVFHRTSLQPDVEWLNFLETLAAQAAIAIDSIQSFESLQHSNAELALAYDTTIEGWSRALDLRDKETEGHTQRVTELTLQLARAAGMSNEELVHVKRGTLLHDIGKMGVPDAILLKSGDLTEEEWTIMRRHPQYAYDMLSPIAYLKPALDIPYCHHEKWDGSGYPRRLKGEQIPLAARIFAVVDVWDALRSDRPYRRAWSEEKTLEYIRTQTGVHFDPGAVELFFQVMKGDP